MTKENGTVPIGLGCVNGCSLRRTLPFADPPVQDKTVLDNEIMKLETELNQMKEQLHKTEI